eukprot:g24265.t1
MFRLARHRSPPHDVLAEKLKKQFGSWTVSLLRRQTSSLLGTCLNPSSLQALEAKESTSHPLIGFGSRQSEMSCNEDTRRRNAEAKTPKSKSPKTPTPPKAEVLKPTVTPASNVQPLVTPTPETPARSATPEQYINNSVITPELIAQAVVKAQQQQQSQFPPAVDLGINTGGYAVSVPQANACQRTYYANQLQVPQPNLYQYHCVLTSRN